MIWLEGYGTSIAAIIAIITFIFNVKAEKLLDPIISCLISLYTLLIYGRLII